MRQGTHQTPQPPAFRYLRYLVVRCLALAILLAATSAFAQLPPSRFPGSFPRPGQPAQGSPEELSAYQAAISQQNPDDRVYAIQQFLTTYPASSLRQSAIAALLAAQSQMKAAQNPAATPNQPASSQTAPAAAAAASDAGSQRDSLLQQSPRQAKVTIESRQLEIKADNSTLSQILHDISGSSGMKVEGLSKDERIFGTYGPGDARDVLLALLEGSGYNVVMVGDLASGTPRELNLTQRGASVGSTPGSAPRRSQEEEADEDQDLQQPPQPEPMPPPQSNGPETPQQPRTPQEILQELQRLRQNQNQPPQNPQ